MKLLSSLSELILEDDSFMSYRGRSRGREYRNYPNIRKGKRQIILFETFHQKVERSGDIDLSDPTNSHIKYKMSMGDWKSGLPTSLIREDITKNFDKIWDESTSYLQTCNEDCRILFKSKHPEFEKIEYVVAPTILDDKAIKLVIVTSASSYDKDYLRTLKRNDPTVTLSEGTLYYGNLKVVYL
jgi:hypothetical protein